MIKKKLLLILIVLILVGFAIAIPFQQWLLASPELIASLGVNTQQSAWTQSVMPSVTYGSWISSLCATLLWIYSAQNGRFVSSKQALSMRLTWWIYALSLYALMSIILYSFIYAVSGIVASEIQYFILLIVFPLDIILLFWLPTAMATPGTLRYIPPLAFNLRRQLGV
jgi:hypothetical protein